MAFVQLLLTPQGFQRFQGGEEDHAAPRLQRFGERLENLEIFIL